MGDKNITITKAIRDEATEVVYTSLATTDNVLIDWDCRDECTTLRFLGGAAESKVTIKAGNGVQGVNDIEFVVPATKYVDVPINSGMFMNTYGENLGKVVLSVSAACSLAVVEEL